MDQITMDRIAKLHPSLRQEVNDRINQANAVLTGRASVRIIQGLRTFPEQQEIYAQGRTKPGKVVTNAKPGQSYHNYGLAFDFCLILDGKEISWDTLKDFDNDGKADWEEVIKVFVDRGWTSGRSFKDLPHLEKSPVHWKKLFDKYERKDFIPGTTYLNL